MNISKALKIKNRLIGEVNRIRGVISRENSRRNDNTSAIDQQKLFDELERQSTNLVNLKGAIGNASL